MTDDIIPIQAYEAAVDHGSIVYYAIVSKNKRIRMPDAFKDMYTQEYLAISKVHSDMPEVFGLQDPDYYIPRRTVD